MDFIDLCTDVTVLRTSGESRGHEGGVEEVKKGDEWKGRGIVWEMDTVKVRYS